MFFFLFAINQVRCVAAVREEREKEKKETALTLFAWLCRFLAISADALFFFAAYFVFLFFVFFAYQTQYSPSKLPMSFLCKDLRKLG